MDSRRSFYYLSTRRAWFDNIGESCELWEYGQWKMHVVVWVIASVLSSILLLLSCDGCASRFCFLESAMHQCLIRLVSDSEARHRCHERLAWYHPNRKTPKAVTVAILLVLETRDRLVQCLGIVPKR
jgi:hypothetical protein